MTCGCDWTGELRHLEKHLSATEEGECLYVEVYCRHGCGQKMTRGIMKEHEEKACLKLPMEVQFQNLQERMERMWVELHQEHQKEIESLKNKITEQEKEITILKDKLHASQPQGEKVCITYDSLKVSALQLMPKLPGGNIPGVHYHATRGRVEIYGCCENEVHARGFRFQLEYQKVIFAYQVKVIDLMPHSDDKELASFLSEFNQKYESTYLFKVNNNEKVCIKVISIVASQFNEVIKSIQLKLTELQVCKMKLSPNCKLTLKIGDITKEDVDVILSSANMQLLHDNHGVAGALNRASNGELQKLAEKYIAQYGRLEVGDIAVTTSGGGNLKCKYIIHVVPPRSSVTNSSDAGDVLTRSITKAFVEAEKCKAASIAIPAIGAGSVLFKTDTVASGIMKAVSTFEYNILKDIRIVVFNSPIYTTFAKHFTTTSNM